MCSKEAVRSHVLRALEGTHGVPNMLQGNCIEHAEQQRRRCGISDPCTKRPTSFPSSSQPDAGLGEICQASVLDTSSRSIDQRILWNHHFPFSKTQTSAGVVLRESLKPRAATRVSRLIVTVQRSAVSHVADAALAEIQLAPEPKR